MKHGENKIEENSCENKSRREADWHKELEMRIRQRTAELVEVNKKLRDEIKERKQAQRLIENGTIML